MFLRIHYTDACGVDLEATSSDDHVMTTVSGSVTMENIEKWVQDTTDGLGGPPDRWDVYEGTPMARGGLLRRWVRRGTEVKEVALLPKVDV